MAEELEYGGFWLPSDFLTDDDDLLQNFKSDPLKTRASNDFSHGCPSSFGFNSDLSSPVDSVMGSTETESDEDDWVAGLTRKMARSALFSDYNRKLSRSPQSTLCACKRDPGGSRVPRVPSQPVAVAGKIAEKQMMQSTAPFQSTNLFAPSQRPSSVHAPVQNLNPTMFNSCPTQTETQGELAYLQLQAIKFKQMKQLQLMELGFCGEAGRTRGSSMAAWPSLQQPQSLNPPPGSAVRPSEPGLNKGRTGTGVFLPRPYGSNLAGTRTKQGRSNSVITLDSSPLLMPEPVVNAVKTRGQVVEK